MVDEHINGSADMPFSNQTFNDIYRESCFCGEVEVEVVCAAVAQLVCHCTVCRSWSATPMTGATLFRPELPRAPTVCGATPGMKGMTGVSAVTAVVM